MKIYLDQFTPSLSYFANEQHVESIFKKHKDSDLIISPENFSTGFTPNKEQLLIYSIKNKTLLQKISSLCYKYQTGFIASFIWQDNENFYNRLFFISSQGEIITSYNKNNLIPAYKEHLFLNTGTPIPPIKYNNLKFGFAICYDLRFPELFRQYALQKVDIIILVAQWPKSRIEHYLTLTKARAIENQCFIIAVNTYGKTKSDIMAGNSMFIDPKGNVLTNLKNRKTGKVIHISDKDIKEMYDYRINFPAVEQFCNKNKAN